MPRSVTPSKITQTKLYNKTYSKFRGVDFSTDPSQVAEYRSPYALNLISDLAGFPEKRVGWRKVKTFANERINGIHYCVFASGAAVRIVHAKDKLHVWDEVEDTAVEIYSGMSDTRSTSFAHGGKLYLMDGAKLRVITEAGGVYAISNVEDTTVFVPTTTIGMDATGGGTPLEAVNMLTPKRINSFKADGKATTYKLDTAPIDSVNKVVVDGVEKAVDTDYTVDLTAGTVTFKAEAAETHTIADAAATVALDSAVFLAKVENVLETYSFTHDGTAWKLNDDTIELADYGITLTGAVANGDTITVTVSGSVPADSTGIDTVVIHFSAAVEGYADRVNKCSIVSRYGYNNDNRFFISGNPDFPNWDWQSGLDDPTYWPDTGYTKIGADTSAIMGYLKQFDSLIIVKADNEQDAEVFIRTSQMQEDGKVIFPVAQGIKGVGAVSRYAFATLQDDPIFLSRDGVYGIASTNVQLERTLQDRSYFVNKRLTAEPDLSEAVCCVWNGYYVLSVNGRCYVADSHRPIEQNDGDSSHSGYGYEWYLWDNIPARVMWEFDGSLYFGDTSGNVCRFNTDRAKMDRFNDDGAAICARWSTKFDNYGSITRRKTLTKKGCGVMIKPYTRSSVTVYVATDRIHEERIQYQTLDILDFSDLDFARITFNTLDTPQVIPLNKKVKKFIILQLIFENAVKDEGFGIYGVQVQYAVGGYVK